ncbi:MAG TPA: zinc ribbon domain-containing protein [Candidatus Acidoferrales bacterium]|nr:zinc ribbon domain-containing protein [Candidatus Acidoferrales bacterium]
MSEVESILRQEAGVKDHPSESPPTVGLKAGAFADLGTLILTNRRLVYINKGGSARAAAWAVGGVFAAQAIENNASKAELDELSSQEGSYAIPLGNITHVEAGKKMGQSFVRVDNVGTPKPVHAYVVSGGTDNQAWVAAINQAKATSQYASSPQAMTYPSQPMQQAYAQPQMAPAQKVCQRCGAADVDSKFCTSCGAPLMQTQPQMNMPPPPPPPPTQTPLCPSCGSQIRYIEQYQRWYCDKEKRYV